MIDTININTLSDREKYFIQLIIDNPVFTDIRLLEEARKNDMGISKSKIPVLKKMVKLKISIGTNEEYFKHLKYKDTSPNKVTEYSNYEVLVNKRKKEILNDNIYENKIFRKKFIESKK